MGYLDGDDIAETMLAAVGWIYSDGYLRRGTRSESNEGDVSYSHTLPEPCLIQQDRITESMRAAPGFSEKDVAFLMLALNSEGQRIHDPDADCELTDGNGTRWQVAAPITLDAGRSHWLFRATPAGPQAPVPGP